MNNREDKEKFHQFVLAHVGYDEDEGVLFFKNGTAHVRIRIHSDPSSPKSLGKCTVAGRIINAGKIVYLVKTGEWTEHDIAYRNENPADIRWNNLYLVPADGVYPVEPDKPPLEPLNEDAPIVDANAAFLADLMTYHPRGPLTYRIASRGVSARYSAATNVTIGSPAGLCAME